MSEHTAPAPAEPVAPAAPEVLNGVKIYPTSFVTTKSALHLPKPKSAEMQEWHIEGIHIVCFFAITFFLFIGMWKRNGLR